MCTKLSEETCETALRGDTFTWVTPAWVAWRPVICERRIAHQVEERRLLGRGDCSSDFWWSFQSPSAGPCPSSRTPTPPSPPSQHARCQRPQPHSLQCGRHTCIVPSLQLCLVNRMTRNTSTLAARCIKIIAGPAVAANHQTTTAITKNTVTDPRTNRPCETANFNP